MVIGRRGIFVSTPLLLLLCATSSAAFTLRSGPVKPPLIKMGASGEEGEHDLKISALTADDAGAASCFAVRRAVFVEEQRVPEAVEMDGRDPDATHILATVHGGVPCGAARLLVSPAEKDGGAAATGKIGRVCVLPSHRGRGIGRSIVLAAVEELRKLPDCRLATLGAQVHALAFYESMGFRLIPGEEYMDAGGVPHRDMEMTL